MRAARDGLRQLVIDAGQSRVGGRDCAQCAACGFVYAAGDAEEERMHDKHHRRYCFVDAIYIVCCYFPLFVTIIFK